MRLRAYTHFIRFVDFENANFNRIKDFKALLNFPSQLLPRIFRMLSNIANGLDTD